MKKCLALAKAGAIEKVPKRELRFVQSWLEEMDTDPQET